RQWTVCATAPAAFEAALIVQIAIEEIACARAALPICGLLAVLTVSRLSLLALAFALPLPGLIWLTFSGLCLLLPLALCLTGLILFASPALSLFLTLLRLFAFLRLLTTARGYARPTGRF